MLSPATLLRKAWEQQQELESLCFEVAQPISLSSCVYKAVPNEGKINWRAIF